MDLTRVFRSAPVSVPKSSVHGLYRSWVSLSGAQRWATVVKLAHTPEELEGAVTLLQDPSRGRCLLRPRTDPEPLSLHHALPTSSFLIARSGSDILAAAAVVKPGLLGLPMDAKFPTAPLRSGRHRVAELSALAVDRRRERRADEVLFPLAKFLYHYCLYCMGVDTLLALLHRDHADFFESLFAFRRMKASGGASAALAWNLPDLAERLGMLYAGVPAEHNLAAYFAGRRGRHLRLPERPYRRAFDVTLTPELLGDFLHKWRRTAGLNLREQELLYRAYGRSVDYLRSGVFPEFSRFRPSGDEVRYEVDCRGAARAVAAGSSAELRVRNVSRHGMCATVEGNLGEHERLVIAFRTGDGVVAVIRARPVWASGDGVYGLRVLRGDANWGRLLHRLQGEFQTRIPFSPASPPSFPGEPDPV